MKMNLKKLIDEADDSILEDIIGRSEKKMVEPFKKKETVIIAAGKPDGEEEEEGKAHEAGEMLGEGVEDKGEKESELSEEDMQALLEMYSKLKGG